MKTTHYPDDLTLSAARARYFADNGFGETGGYEDKFVEIKLGPVTVPFPNTKSRARAVRYHDLHHLVTGYGTDFASETAISAWEVGAGCGTSAAAWLIDLSAMGVGLVASPRATVGAFVRGRRSQSLFGKPFEPLLGRTIADVRAAAHVPAFDVKTPMKVGDGVMLAAATLGALIAVPIVTLGTLLVAPFGLMALAARRRAQPTT